MARLVKAGAIVCFISEGVMVGFKCGLALFLASTQLPKLCGFHGMHGDFWENSAHFLKHLQETNSASLSIGVAALAVLVVGKKFFQNQPVALFVVVGGILASSLLGLDARGVKLLGEVPQGGLTVGLPAILWSDLNELLPLALACFLLGAVETSAVGRTFAAKHGGRLDVNQEIVALAAANLAAGLGQGFPVSGGMSQSAVNEGGGARTPLSGAIAATVILMVVLFLSRLLQPLPQPVLAAVVLVAVAGLFSLSALQQLWRGDRRELAVALAAILGVLGSGLLRGVLIGAVISLVQLLRRASRPHVAVLGRIPGTRRFSDRERHQDNEPIPGVLIFRPESGLLYFNVDHVRDLILDRTRAEATPPQLVVLDLSAAPLVDLQSAYTLAVWPTNSPLPASACRPSRHAPRCETACATRAWMPDSAGSIGSSPWPMLWKPFRNRLRPEDSPEDEQFADRSSPAPIAPASCSRQRHGLCRDVCHQPGAPAAIPAIRRIPARGWPKPSEMPSASLNLVPFTGIAFLWFMAVLRNRVGYWKIGSSRRCSSAAGCFSS